MNNKTLLENLRCIPDFPKKGINFRDVTTLFSNPECLQIMEDELYDLYKDKGITKIVGHRDLSCDADGDGIVERHEWVKQCPGFDVAAEYGSFALWNAGRKGGSND